MIPSMQAAWLVTGAAIGGALLAIGVNLLTTPGDADAVNTTNLTAAGNLPSLLGAVGVCAASTPASSKKSPSSPYPSSSAGGPAGTRP